MSVGLVRRAGLAIHRWGPVNGKRSFSNVRDASYCLDLVKKRDHDNFLVGLMLPQRSRDAFFAIRAFNIELVSIPETVGNNVHIGQIRMQWWRDALKTLFEGSGPVPEHPVLGELAIAVATHGLTERWFQYILEQREMDLDPKDESTIEETLQYVDQTAAAGLYLALECVTEGSEADDDAYAAALYVGRATGLITLLRGAPHFAREERMLLPADLLAEHGTSAAEFFALAKKSNGVDMPAESPTKGMTAAVQEISAMVEEYLGHAAALQKDVPAAAVPALLPAVSARLYLDRLQATQHNIFDPQWGRR
jgi:phytoene/squalene synthetase